MKTTFIGHASILVEIGGLKVLSDPWWEGPCFGTQWWVYPPVYSDPVKTEPVDYIYISHGHHDHLHLGTLRRLPKGATYLVSDEVNIADYLSDQGFNVKTIKRDEEVDLGNNVKCRIIPTCNGDTMMAISDGTEVLVNLNDAVHAAPKEEQDKALNLLIKKYGKIDYMFCGYGVASHFPCCYIVPGMDREKTAANRQAHFNREWVYIVETLSPRMAFPFAADVSLLEEELIWANEPIHNTERPTDVFTKNNPSSETRVFDIAPSFIIEDGAVTNNILFEPLDIEILRKDHARGIEVSNRVAKTSMEGLNTLLEIIKQNVTISRSYLLEFDGNYRFLIELKGDERSIEVIKKNQSFDVNIVKNNDISKNDYDLILTVRYSYLRRCLTTPYGHEVLYVGSGCLFEYTDKKRIIDNLNNEFQAIIRKNAIARKSRYGDQPKWLYSLKMYVKKILGYDAPDKLSNLSTWMIFKK